MGLAVTLAHAESDTTDTRIAARPAMPHMPALDGIRAIAVAAVLLYHAEAPWLPGGFLGVEVFFVVSGYLITALLLAEVQRSGHIDLGRFWARRARRLLPALAFYLLGSLGLALALAPDVVDEWIGGSWAAAFYVANWHAVLNDVSYTEAFGRPSFLHHLWSLAVEEQFYLLWPIMLAAGLRHFGRQLTLALVVAGIAGSTLLMRMLYTPLEDPLRIYYGTDTRASGLLVGAALAFVWRPWEYPTATKVIARRRASVGVALGIAGTLWVVRSFVVYDLSPIHADPLFRGGFLITSLATAALIAGLTVADTPVSRAFSNPVFRWAGTRSYGIYLWHWPIFGVTRPRVDVDIEGPVLFLVRLAATLVAAEVSYRLVEERFRRSHRPTFVAPSRLAPVRSALPAVLGGAALIASFAVLVNLQRADVVDELRAGAIVDQDLVIENGTVVEDASADTADATSDTDVATSDTDTGSDTGTGTEQSAEATPPEIDPGAAPIRPVDDTATDAVSTPSITRVTLVGDSVMAGASAELGRLGRSVVLDAAVGRQWWDVDAVLREIGSNEGFGDAVVLHLGNNGPLNAEMFDDVARRLRRVDRFVVVNVRAPVRWEAPVNEALRKGVARWDNAVLVDWHRLSNDHPEYFTPDGVHLEADGRRAYLRAIRDALRS